MAERGMIWQNKVRVGEILIREPIGFLRSVSHHATACLGLEGEVVDR